MTSFYLSLTAPPADLELCETLTPGVQATKTLAVGVDLKLLYIWELALLIDGLCNGISV